MAHPFEIFLHACIYIYTRDPGLQSLPQKGCNVFITRQHVLTTASRSPESPELKRLFYTGGVSEGQQQLWAAFIMITSVSQSIYVMYSTSAAQ